jgi:hypothetical protein
MSTSSTRETRSKALHGYVSNYAHATWHDLAAYHGVSVSALLEALANTGALDITLKAEPNIVVTARKVDTTRRSRTFG